MQPDLSLHHRKRASPRRGLRPLRSLCALTCVCLGARSRGGVEYYENRMDVDGAVKALKQAVGILKNNPNVLQREDMLFFRDYLRTFGVQLAGDENRPETVEQVTARRQKEKAEKAAAAQKQMEEDDEMEDEDPADIVPEEDADVAEPPAMGDMAKEPTDEEHATAAELRGRAAEALAAGDHAAAVVLFTQIVEATPTANALAGRAAAFNAMRKPAG